MLVATVELRVVCAGSSKEITIVHVSCIERERDSMIWFYILSGVIFKVRLYYDAVRNGICQYENNICRAEYKYKPIFRTVTDRFFRKKTKAQKLIQINTMLWTFSRKRAR